MRKLVVTEYLTLDGVMQDPGGSEQTRCLFTKLPGNEDFLIKGYHAHMLPGSHHFNMFWTDPTAPGIDLPPRLGDWNDVLTGELTGAA